MPPEIPLYITITFLITVLTTIVFFYRSVSLSLIGKRKKNVTLGVVLWLVLQGILSYSMFYLDTAGSLPPPFTFMGFIPSFILMSVLFLTISGRRFIDTLSLFDLALLSIIRIPVEIVLYWLFMERLIPEAMTFQGYNFDILAGITAPFIAYFGYKQSILNNTILILWNIVSLLLLITIILLSIFSFPSVIQQYAFAQPNIGMLYFPFFWLPSFIVPIVFFSHLVAIRQLMLGTGKKNEPLGNQAAHNVNL